MSRRPIAEVRVIRMPNVATGGIRVEVACVGSTTGITYLPSAVELDVPALTAFAIYVHQARCSVGCDTTEAHRHCDPQDYEHVRQAVTTVQNIRSQRHAGGRRD